MGSDLGDWEPLDLHVAIDLFASAGFRWWVTGGHALEMHVDRSWRSHADTDLSFCRSDSALVRRLLGSWDVHVAAAGRLSRWDGGPLHAEMHQNNLWCRRTSSDPWALDLTISDGDDTDWIFRRDPSLRVPWSEAVLRSSAGVPYLAPELQLLYKSRDPRPKDETDLLEVLPDLEPHRLSLLAGALQEDHPWQLRIATT